MLGGLLVVMSVSITGFEDAPKPVPDDRAAYEAASQAAGKDAAAHVRLALWCEAHGMTAERMKHLAAAVAADPSLALARGLMGLVSVGGKWERPEEVAREAKDDPGRKALMEDYLRRRAKAADRADDQWRLAVWCDQNGLKEQAIAHYYAVLRLDPKREAAWKHLGFKKADGRWVKPEVLEAERREAEAQGRANKHWRPILERWRAALSSHDKVRRAAAEAGLAGVTDPRAVPMIWAVFVTRRADEQAIAVRALEQVDSPGSSRALALISVFGSSVEIRQAAVRALRPRDPRDYLGVLVGLVRDTLKYEIRPDDRLHSVGQLFVEGKRYNVRFQYLVERDGVTLLEKWANGLPRLFAPWVPYDPYGPFNLALASRGMMWNMGAWAAVQAPGVAGPGVPAALAGIPQANAAARHAAGAIQPGQSGTMLNGQILNMETLAAERDLQIAQRRMAVDQIIELSRQQLRNDVQTIEDYNADVLRVNDLAVPVLNSLTGADVEDSGEAWRAWWSDQRGYAYSSPPAPSSKPTYSGFVLNPLYADLHSCFAAGTAVQTLDGPRPIESIWVGDQVLAQDVRTGKLAYTPVVAVYHNPPATTFRINLDGQAIVATGIHRFWKAGKGWVMTRELKPGDVLRALGGVARVKSVEAEKTQPVFNLRVARGESYFVGASGVLAHDNSTIEPVPEPFDAVGPLPAGSLSSQPRPRRSMLGR